LKFIEVFLRTVMVCSRQPQHVIVAYRYRI
jgi:hypothetical protein